MQVLIAISGFCGFCSRIGNAPCTTPFDFLFVISIYVPAWGTTMVTVPVILLSLFQSTFPRGERPAAQTKPVPCIEISIHVPAWGTTMLSSSIFLDFRISIHVPAWGTTARGWAAGRNYGQFQSTFPRGERQTPCTHCFLQDYFNPRSRMGNDQVAFQVCICVVVFQSTFPHGERPRSARTVIPLAVFQSTFPHGERLFFL